MFNTIFKGTAIGILNKVIAALASFIILPLMLEKLGTDTYGIWVTIVSTIGVMSFLDLGIGYTILSFVAGTADKEEISKFIKTAYTIQFYFIGTIIILFITSFYFINWGLVFNVKNLSTDTLLAILITFVFFFISIITSSIFSIQIALQKSILANTWQLCGTIVYLASIFLVLTYAPNLKWVAFTTYALPVVVATFNTITFFNKEKLYYKNKAPINWTTFRLFLTKSGMFLVLQIASLICFQSDCLILAHFLNFNDVAKFSITAKLFSIPTLLLAVYLQILWPLYAKAFKNNEWNQIKKLFSKSLLYAIAISITFIILIFLFKSPLLYYWLNGKIQISTHLLVAFGTFLIVNVIDINIASMLNGLNKIKIQIYFAILMVISNLVLSIILVDHWGIAGVVWGSTFATLFFSVLPFLFFIRKLFSENIK